MSHLRDLIKLAIEKREQDASRPWLIGENNPYGNRQDYDLFTEPEGSAGWRLCHQILGVLESDYYICFERRNLLRQVRWSAPMARDAARKIWTESGKAPLILLGRKVATAFNLHSAHLFAVWHLPERNVVTLSHPSGRSLLWNDAGNIERARKLVIEVAPHLKDIVGKAAERRWMTIRTDSTVERPAKCANCGIRVEGRDCPDCGPMF